jgi:hypothetical protein
MFSREGLVFATGGATNYTATTERMRIDSSGNVGIGTTSPSATLNVNGPSQFTGGGTFPVSGSGIEIVGVVAGGINYIQTYDRTGNAWQELNINTGITVFSTQGSERMRIDSSGNVGIGTSSPSASARLHVTGSSSNAEVRIQNTNSASNERAFLRVQSSSSSFGGAVLMTNAAEVGYVPSAMLVYNFDNQPLVFGTSNAERMRIDSSGNVLINCIAVPNVAASPQQFGVASAITNEFVISRNNNGTALYIKNVGGATATAISFFNGSSSVGSVTTTASTTAYNTSSDYRLKENVAPMVGALDTVAQLKPVTYNWKADGSDGQGFIAHELAEVVPDCVTGQKDAVDAEGKPIYQGVDTSFLVATLTAAIQELNAKVEALEAQLNKE